MNLTTDPFSLFCRPKTADDAQYTETIFFRPIGNDFAEEISTFIKHRALHVGHIEKYGIINQDRFIVVINHDAKQKIIYPEKLLPIKKIEISIESKTNSRPRPRPRSSQHKTVSKNKKLNICDLSKDFTYETTMIETQSNFCCI